MTQMRQHLRYLSYLLRHKWFVFLAGLKTGAPLWRLIIHDWSKLLPCEWFPYANYFYGQPTIGDTVSVVSFDGVSGPATIVDTRRQPGSRFKVRIHEGYIGETQEFWAMDDEVPVVLQMQSAFDQAWLHHQHANPHHWQHWILRKDDGGTVNMRMPDHFAREMVADWMGAGRAITGRWEVAEWYGRNKGTIELHSATRVFVEELMSRVCGDTAPVDQVN